MNVDLFVLFDLKETRRGGTFAAFWRGHERRGDERNETRVRGKKRNRACRIRIDRSIRYTCPTVDTRLCQRSSCDFVLPLFHAEEDLAKVK